MQTRVLQQPRVFWCLLRCLKVVRFSLCILPVVGFALSFDFLWLHYKRLVLGNFRSFWLGNSRVFGRIQFWFFEYFSAFFSSFGPSAKRNNNLSLCNANFSCWRFCTFSDNVHPAPFQKNCIVQTEWSLSVLIICSFPRFCKLYVRWALSAISTADNLKLTSFCIRNEIQKKGFIKISASHN